MITKYFSFDGIEFDSKEECEYYEKYLDSHCGNPEESYFVVSKFNYKIDDWEIINIMPCEGGVDEESLIEEILRKYNITVDQIAEYMSHKVFDQFQNFGVINTTIGLEFDNGLKALAYACRHKIEEFSITEIAYKIVNCWNEQQITFDFRIEKKCR